MVRINHWNTHTSSYIASINIYYQKANVAKEFKRTIEASGATKFEPKFDRHPENVKVQWEQIPENELIGVDVPFEDLEFIFKDNKPDEDMKLKLQRIYRFENKHPNHTVYDLLREKNALPHKEKKNSFKFLK